MNKLFRFVVIAVALSTFVVPSAVMARGESAVTAAKQAAIAAPLAATPIGTSMPAWVPTAQWQKVAKDSDEYLTAVSTVFADPTVQGAINFGMKNLVAPGNFTPEQFFNKAWPKTAPLDTQKPMAAQAQLNKDIKAARTSDKKAGVASPAGAPIRAKTFFEMAQLLGCQNGFQS